MTDWKPMTLHSFPWEHRRIVVMAFDCEDTSNVEIFRCRVGEHGALFPGDEGMLTIIEQRWVPYAWQVDDTPEPDNAKYPPMWKDYLRDLTPRGHGEDQKR